MQGSRGSKKGTSVFHGMEPHQGCTLLIWDTIISYVSDKSIDLIRYIDQSDERDRRFVRVHHMKKTIRIGKAKKLSSPLWLRHKKKSWSHTWIGMWSKDSRHRIELHRFIKFYIHLFTSKIISLFLGIKARLCKKHKSTLANKNLSEFWYLKFWISPFSCSHTIFMFLTFDKFI